MMLSVKVSRLARSDKGLKALMLAAGISLLSACATQPPAPPGPVRTYVATAACSDIMSAGSATTVTVKRRKSSGEVVTPIDAASACFNVDGSSRPYAIFRLPGSVKIESIQAGGVFQRNRLLAAEVVTLNAELAPVRTFGPEAFLHRGGSWSAFFRAREQEKYIAVRANPALIGSGYYFTQFEPLPPGSPDPAQSDIQPLGLRTDYSYEGLAFVRVFLSEPSDTPVNKQ